MSKILKIILILAVVSAGWFFKDYLLDFYSKFSLKLPGIEENINNLVSEQLEKKISLPSPMRAKEESLQSFLTLKGVIEKTNAQRADFGLPALKENINLDASAKAKVEDMFNGQYFEHISPFGVGVSDLAENSGYEYIMIGENLALGNFKDDAALVQAWMDSPGHRANILNERYADMGVSVIKGTFEGETTWLAVQHFGLPLSACDGPQETLKAKIELNQAEIQELKNSLMALKEEIEGMNPRRQREEYNARVEEYNNLVSRYNNLLAETKGLTETYNVQVAAFNECVSSQ